jgi:hypothetical protein
MSAQPTCIHAACLRVQACSSHFVANLLPCSGCHFTCGDPVSAAAVSAHQSLLHTLAIVMKVFFQGRCAQPDNSQTGQWRYPCTRFIPLHKPCTIRYLLLSTSHARSQTCMHVPLCCCCIPLDVCFMQPQRMGSPAPSWAAAKVAVGPAQSWCPIGRVAVCTTGQSTPACARCMLLRACKWSLWKVCWL